MAEPVVVFPDRDPTGAPDLARLLTLFAQQVRERGFTALSATSLESFVAQPGATLLLFAEDPRRVPESWDVAVVLPDLVSRFAPGARVGLLDPVLARAQAARYGVCQWPSLVALRDGQYLGEMARMRDWSEYAAALPALLEGAPRLPPATEAGMLAPEVSH